MSSFAELVNEAFIQPLRSVLIVDDEYPTWEEILNFQLDEGVKNIELDARSRAKSWRQNPSLPLQVIKKFRERSPGFVIDIHDALADGPVQTVSEGETVASLANHLHQSDLLVLDYNLEGAGTGLKGKKAREILHSVLSNQHFNLIIVHTGEDSLEEVAEECVLSLLTSCSSKLSKREAQDIAEIEEKITDMEDESTFDRTLLREYFNKSQYLHARRIGFKDAIREYMANTGPLASLRQFAESLFQSPKDKKSFLLWSINELEEKQKDELSSSELEGLNWSISQDYKWIRTARGFVCFVGKGPENLLEELENALVDWKPTPSRLLSAKYRHELNRIGVEAEDDALLKHHLFALFYKDIRDGARSDILESQRVLYREQKLKEHVSRQTEGLSFLIEDNVIDFGKKIILIDQQSEDQCFLSHYNVDLEKSENKQKAIAQYNHYVSNLPLKNTSEQLDCGHIFKIEEKWWVCATPACDLQPGQNSIAFNGKSDKLRPFLAFQLSKENPDKLTPEHINGGGYCFVEYEGRIIALGINSIGKEEHPSNLKINWKTFVAESGGVIKNGKLIIKQFTMTEEDVSTEQKEIEVISKLRYAYALNYIQRVGISTSRIGLDYVS